MNKHLLVRNLFIGGNAMTSPRHWGQFSGLCHSVTYRCSKKST